MAPPSGDTEHWKLIEIIVDLNTTSMLSLCLQVYVNYVLTYNFQTVVYVDLT